LRLPDGRLLLVLLLGLWGVSGAASDPADSEASRIRDPDLYGLAVRGQAAWAVGYWGSVLRSEDGGRSWSAVEAPTRATLFDVAFADARHGWAVGEYGTLLRTRDGGRSWEPQSVTVDDPFTGRHRLDTHLFGVSVLSPGAAWAVGDLGVVIRTRDGEAWEHVPIAEETWADEEVPDRILNAVDFPDPLHGWIVGEFGTTLRTADGGASWQGERTFLGVAEDLYLYDVSALDGEQAAAVGLAGHVIVTGDGGRTWEPRRASTPVPLYAVEWSNPAAVAVGNRGEMRVTRDLGRSWLEPERPRLFNWLAGVRAGADGTFLAVGEKGLILRSEDHGASWVQRFGREPPPLSGVSVPQPGPSRELGREERRVPLLP
jgi:photosystem II stability/assembly factor-like uncharacterized protein